MPKIHIITDTTTEYQKKLLKQILSSVGIFDRDCTISEGIYEPIPECNIIVTMSQNALKMVCGIGNLEDVRGTLLSSLQGIKVMPTIHLERIVKDWSMLPIITTDLAKAKKESEFKQINIPQWDFTLHPTFQGCMSFLDHLDTQNEFAFDLEVSRKTGEITHIGLASSATKGISIPFSNNIWTQEQEVALWEAVAKVLGNSKKKIAHNASYDVAVLWERNRIKTNNLYFDTIIAFHICYIEMEKNLGFIASMLLTVPAWKHTSKVDMDYYNVMDACNTYAIAKILEKEIITRQLEKVFAMEMSEIEPCIFMSLRGIKVDIIRKLELRLEFENKLIEVESKIQQYLWDKHAIGHTVNLRSPKQLKELLYVHLGLPIQTKRHTGVVTTDEKALEALAKKTSNPILDNILKHREYSKLIDFCNFDEDMSCRVYTSYNITGTDTGRWSSSKNIIKTFGTGNLQQIPSRGYGGIVREMYVCSSPDKWIVQADFVQAEAVIVAYLIGDEVLKQAFRDKKDIHKLTASLMFNAKLEEVTPEMREIGKKIRHAVNYSFGAKGLSEELKIDLKLAKHYLESFHNSCPQLKRWHLKVQEELGRTRVLSTPLGRKRKFYGRIDDSMYRSAYAFIPQSTIGDLLNKSLLEFYNLYGDKYSILLQLHDAMYIDDVADEDIEDCISKMKKCMTWEIPINGETCIVDVDFKKGKNWSKMEKIK